MVFIVFVLLLVSFFRSSSCFWCRFGLSIGDRRAFLAGTIVVERGNLVASLKTQCQKRKQTIAIKYVSSTGRGGERSGGEAFCV